MKHIASFIFFLSFALCAGEPIRVLAIGNSFSWQMTRWLPPVAASAGVEIQVDDITIGGCTMERHWENIVRESEEADYHFFEDFTYLQKITSKNWDYITIQQASHESWRLESYRPYARYLRDFLRKNAPDAEILLQMTWAWRQDDQRYKRLAKTWKDDPLFQFNTSDLQEYMFFLIQRSYLQTAHDLGLRVIPTGAAVQLARQTQSPKYIPFAPEDYQYPNLPDVSRALCGNVRWNNDHSSLAGDSAHLNDRGNFLQACVWFGILTGHSIDDITYAPKGLSPEDIAFLKDVAKTAIDTYPRGPRKR